MTNRITVAAFIVITGGLCHAAMEISQGVVFQANGTLDIICSTTDIVSIPDIVFIWHHNGSLKEEGEQNFVDIHASELKLYYQLHIPRATQNDTGRYTCNIEGNPDAVSMSATMVKINDAPVVAEMDDTLDVHILKDPNPDIKCFRADALTSVENCVERIQVTDVTVSKIHKFIIASKKAIEEYDTVGIAMQKKTTFNFSKEIIGIERKKGENGVYLLNLKGNRNIIENMNITCSGSTTKLSPNITGGPSYDGVNQTYECEKSESQVTAEVYWQGLLLRKFSWTTDAAHIPSTNLHLWWILLALYLYLYKLR